MEAGGFAIVFLSWLLCSLYTSWHLAEKLSFKISLPPKDIPNDISQYSTSVLPSSLFFFSLFLVRSR